MLEKVVLIHYHELALKGENRPFFERTLFENIKKSLGYMWRGGKLLSGRIAVALSDGTSEEEAVKRLKRVFGIANFSFAFVFPCDFDTLSKEVLSHIREKDFRTFRIAARRADKSYPLTSQDINERLGTAVKEKFGKQVDLEQPDLTCFVEVTGKSAFVYFKKYKGYGGLPTGVSGKALSLISSGFDSPVASWKIMRRGCTLSFIHFHSYPSTSAASQENVKEIVKVLSAYEGKAKLHLVPFLSIQQAIVKADIPSRNRVVLYRRCMARIAEVVAKKEKYGALVTGESLGQVASQTLENIAVISAAVSIPIFRPLIGENKEHIIAWAREIGTHDISAQPYDDCCSLFVPDHPETKANVRAVEEMERELDVEDLVADAVGKIELHEYATEG